MERVGGVGGVYCLDAVSRYDGRNMERVGGVGAVYCLDAVSRYDGRNMERVGGVYCLDAVSRCSERGELFIYITKIFYLCRYVFSGGSGCGCFVGIVRRIYKADNFCTCENDRIKIRYI